MAAEIKAGTLYRETDKQVKFPRIVKIKKLAEIGPLTYVYFMAENQAAQAIHPNGGFLPIDNFLRVWEPVSEAGAKYSGRSGPA